MKLESMRRSLRDLQDLLHLSPANAKVLRNRPASKCPFATLRQVSQNRDFRTASVAAYEFATRNGSSGFKETTPRTSGESWIVWSFVATHLVLAPAYQQYQYLLVDQVGQARQNFRCTSTGF